MRFLIFSLFLVSCGTDDYYDQFQKPHKKRVIVQVEELRPYIDMFEKHAAQYGKSLIIDDLIIGFGDVDVEGDDSETLGVCYRSTNRTPEVVLDIKHWKNLNPTRRMLLVYHELGHCVLNRGHIEQEKYESIMSPYLMYSSDFNRDPSYFLEELFNQDVAGDWLLLHGHNDKCNH